MIELKEEDDWVIVKLKPWTFCQMVYLIYYYGSCVHGYVSTMYRLYAFFCVLESFVNFLLQAQSIKKTWRL
jgi:hypothetical protein